LSASLERPPVRDARVDLLREEYQRLAAQHDILQREHEALKVVPTVDRLGHFRRLEAHREQLRAFRQKLNER
jgi:hypothetical protein